MSWWDLKHSSPAAHRSRSLRNVVEQTVAGEHVSNHSAMALTLPIMIEAFEKARVPYRIHAYPGQGYVIERIKVEQAA